LNGRIISKSITMKINRKNKISKIIYLIDKHIVDLLTKEDLDEEKIETLTTIRGEYIQELNNIIRGENTKEMFDKEYHKMYKKTRW
jgi:hypothetical protein